MKTFTLTVNGQTKEVTVDPGTPLLWALREDLKLTGTKYGCGNGTCGACTLHLGGVATRSCLVPVSMVGNRPIITIEAMAEDPVGHIVRDAWVSLDVVQCGYCQSGQIMSAVALLKRTSRNRWAEISAAAAPTSAFARPSRRLHGSLREVLDDVGNSSRDWFAAQPERIYEGVRAGGRGG
jgi:isoquinoline 1-oxidoreductase alpha subunit